MAVDENEEEDEEEEEEEGEVEDDDEETMDDSDDGLEQRVQEFQVMQIAATTRITASSAPFSLALASSMCWRPRCPVASVCQRIA